jgi:hypothetical protein
MIMECSLDSAGIYIPRACGRRFRRSDAAPAASARHRASSMPALISSPCFARKGVALSFRR